MDKSHLNTYHIGFVLGPCLNASGRLDTAKRALSMLQAKDKKEADLMAGDLKALNDSRKELTLEAVEQAAEQVETTDILNDRVLVIYLPDCHESLAGIVAGRIREKYYRPVFVLTDAESGIKGSGRSIEGYHMYEELSKCKRLLTKFGGHALAAGVSLEKENVEEFRRMLNMQCTLTEKEMREKIMIDMEMPFHCVTEQFVSELELLEPFGKGNTKPVFAARNVEVLNTRILGKNRNVLKLQVRDQNHTVVDAMYFGDIQEMMQRIQQKPIMITYYPKLNDYMGKITPQIVITHYQ